MNETIERASRVLKRIEPEFFAFVERKDEIIFEREFFGEGQSFYSVNKSDDLTWKDLVKKFISAIDGLKYFANECNKWGCD